MPAKRRSCPAICGGTKAYSRSLASKSEGDPASLTVVVKRPRNVSGDPIGLLGPGRKIWAGSRSIAGTALFKFRGRLVGVPTSIFEELVTLEFVARPFDVVAQKEALAATLRVLPYYDEVVIDPTRRTDPEVVLEGYSKIWHYDRETHVLTVSRRDRRRGWPGRVRRRLRGRQGFIRRPRPDADQRAVGARRCHRGIHLDATGLRQRRPDQST